MFESIFIINSILVIMAGIMLLIAAKAASYAWQRSNLHLESSEGSWGWWIELHTDHPDCLYYFGPFSNAAEAANSIPGYMQDLSDEGADNITVQVKWCKPSQLTSLSALALP